MFKKRIVMLCSLLISATVFAGNYNQAPMLDKLVKEGKLLSVEKRLPDNPLVVEVTDEIGRYGGTAYLSNSNFDGFGDDFCFVGMEPPLFLNNDSTITPNVLEKCELSEDSKEALLYLRKGIKWSDGVPFTADDIMFFWKDEINNKDCFSFIYMDFLKGSEFEKIDDYTVKIKFRKPYPLFKITLAREWANQGKWWSPKHYMKQFNSHYVDREELRKKSELLGFSTITEYYGKQAQNACKPTNIGCPTLNAYTLTDKKRAIGNMNAIPTTGKLIKKVINCLILIISL